MNLAQVIADRHAATGASDPDSLHGLLFSLETKAQQAANLPTITRSLGSISRLLNKARNGEVGRVHAFKGAEYRREVIEYPDGLLPVRWKRDLVCLLLRPDGVVTSEVTALINQHNVNCDSAQAMSTLRSELRVFGIEIEGSRIEGQLAFRFKITGRSAWRMQKIVANGWSL